MYTRDSSDKGIDSIICVSGEFTLSGDPGDPDVAAETNMAYYDSRRGLSLGSCTMSQAEMSVETVAALKAFLESAEKDFGDLVFGDGDVGSPDAEQDVGIGAGMADLTKR
jgi:hypothetical protein